MTTKRVVIVDYHLGNLFSVQRACEHLGCTVSVSSEPSELAQADALILPGVGAFGQAMDNLARADLVSPLRDHVAANKPLLGICLGLQLLFEESEEFGSPRGLGLVPGTVKRFSAANAPVPQIGWNQVFPPEAAPSCWQETPMAGVRPGEFMYFVHSYYVVNSRVEDALTTTDYEGFCYTSAVRVGSVFATQYHPEKSAEPGLMIYQAWLQMVDASGKESGP